MTEKHTEKPDSGERGALIFHEWKPSLCLKLRRDADVGRSFVFMRNKRTVRETELHNVRSGLLL